MRPTTTSSSSSQATESCCEPTNSKPRINKGIPECQDKASEFLLQAARLGHTEAQWKLAADAIARGDHEHALHWCDQAANQSTPHPQALARMGQYHLEGKIVTRDLEVAFQYYQRAAELKHRGALFQLAQMHERGQGCKVDFREAARCYIVLARDYSCPESMFCLGNLYMMGDGVTMDPDKAFQLWERAAKLGHEGAQSFLTLRDLATDF